MWAGVTLLVIFCGYLFLSVRKHRTRNHDHYSGNVIDFNGYRTRIMSYDPNTNTADVDWDDPPDEAA